MIKAIRGLLPGILLAASASAFAGAECQAPSWCEVDVGVASGLVNDSGQVVDGDGVVLTDGAGRPLVPDCAFGPAKVVGSDPVPYYFFYQEGSDPDDVVVFHSGGGPAGKTTPAVALS
jgi:hypothetical protein